MDTALPISLPASLTVRPVAALHSAVVSGIARVVRFRAAGASIGPTCRAIARGVRELSRRERHNRRVRDKVRLLDPEARALALAELGGEAAMRRWERRRDEEPKRGRVARGPVRVRSHPDEVRLGCGRRRDVSGRFALARVGSGERRKATWEELRVLAERRAWRERMEGVEIAGRLAELRAMKAEDDARAKAWCARHGVVWAWGEAAVEVTPDELRWGLAVYGVGIELGRATADGQDAATAVGRSSAPTPPPSLPSSSGLTRGSSLSGIETGQRSYSPAATMDPRVKPEDD